MLQYYINISTIIIYTKKIYLILLSDIMVSNVGPIVDIDIDKLKTKRYRCLNCGNKFKGHGSKVICPSCQSDNVQ